jgi:hypothetical protein
VIDNGFDGLYLDQRLSPALYGEVLAAHGLQNVSVDSDGDGKANSLSDIVDQYATWAPVLTRGLRAALGPDAIILANSAGELNDTAVNGLTIEMEACINITRCQEAISASCAVAVLLLPCCCRAVAVPW